MRRHSQGFLVTFFLLACCAASSFAAGSSYIRMDSPEDGEHRHTYSTSVNDVRYVFRGSVSADCVSIRALWASGSKDSLQGHFEQRSSAIRGVYDDYTLKKFTPGDRTFVYNVGGALDNLAFGSNFYRFIARFKDGTTRICELAFYLYEGGVAEREKPVIYLYPTKTRTVRVSVAPTEPLTRTIPEMGKGWQVTATPEGRIFDKKTGDEYPYLFWESADDGTPIDMSEGFVVSTDNLRGFFEEKLAVLGLNAKESGDFLEWWLPRLTGKPYVFITFYTRERIDAEAPLSVSPRPDSVIRVYFDHKLLDAPVEVREQRLEPARRTGFAVVEWGGRGYLQDER